MPDRLRDTARTIAEVFCEVLADVLSGALADALSTALTDAATKAAYAVVGESGTPESNGARTPATCRLAARAPALDNTPPDNTPPARGDPGLGRAGVTRLADAVREAAVAAADPTLAVLPGVDRAPDAQCVLPHTICGGAR